MKKTRKIVDELTAAGIEPILIKGLAAAQNYPVPYQRNFSDIDLAVMPELYDKALEFLKDDFYEVDLHKGLRHLDTLEWEKLFSNSRIHQIDDISVRFLSPEDHLRVLCVHFLNDGASNRQRIWDIYFAVANRSIEFSWEKFYNPVEDKRRHWLRTALLICSKYTGLRIEHLEENDYKLGIPEWIWGEVEHEWSSDTGIIPLNRTLTDRKNFVDQLKKRIPPNGITSFVECEADWFETGLNRTRIAGGLKRAKPSVRRIFDEIFKSKK